MKVKNRKGFTLAELLIVMAIVVVLAAVAVPTFGRQLETSRETSDMEVVRNCYEEVLSAATLDSLDGTLDMQMPGDGTTAKAIHYNGISNAGSDGKYTVTLADLDAKPKMTQGTKGWQFVNGYLFGIPVENVFNDTLTLEFTFTFTDGILVLSKIEGKAQ